MRKVKQKGPSLEELAAKANECFREEQGLKKQTIGLMRKRAFKARDAGEALNHAKNILAKCKREGKKLRSGEEAPLWREWLADKFDGSPRTAALYMRIAAKWDKVYQHIVHNPKVTIRQLDKMLRTRTRKEKLQMNEGLPSRTPTKEEQRQSLLGAMQQELQEAFQEETKRWMPWTMHFLTQNRCAEMRNRVRELVKQLGPLPRLFWKAHCRYAEDLAGQGGGGHHDHPLGIFHFRLLALSFVHREQ
jgi:hypothetical protein